MADLNQLLAALGAGQQTIQKQDIYSPLSNVANEIGGLAVKTATPDNWKQAALASAISGLVGGVTGGMGANYQAEQQGLYQQALLNSLGGIAAKPEGMSDALYKNAQTQAQSLQMQDMFTSQLEDKAAERKLQQLLATDDASREQARKYLDEDLGVLRQKQEIMAETRPMTAGERVIEDPTVRSAVAKLRAQQYGIELPEGGDMTPEEVLALSSAPLDVQRLTGAVEGRAAVADRFGQRIDLETEKRQEKKRELVIPEYVFPENPNIPRLQPKEAQAERDRLRGIAAISEAVDSLAQGNPLSLFGENAIRNKNSNALILGAMKDYANMGSRVSNEQHRIMLDAIQPTLASGRTLDTILAAMTWRDKQMFADVLKEAMLASADSRMMAVGGLRRTRPYSGEELEEYGRRFGLTPTQVADAFGVLE